MTQAVKLGLGSILLLGGILVVLSGINELTKGNTQPIPKAETNSIESESLPDNSIPETVDNAQTEEIA